MRIEDLQIYLEGNNTEYARDRRQLFFEIFDENLVSKVSVLLEYILPIDNERRSGFYCYSCASSKCIHADFLKGWLREKDAAEIFKLFREKIPFDRLPETPRQMLTAVYMAVDGYPEIGVLRKELKASPMTFNKYINSKKTKEPPSPFSIIEVDDAP